ILGGRRLRIQMDVMSLSRRCEPALRRRAKPGTHTIQRAAGSSPLAVVDHCQDSKVSRTFNKQIHPRSQKKTASCPAGEGGMVEEHFYMQKDLNFKKPCCAPRGRVD